MSTEALTLQIDAEAAQAFKAASAEEQEKFAILISAWLKESAKPDNASLKQVMDEVGRKAQSRGLTPEILESILGER